MKDKKETSWGNVSDWYSSYLEDTKDSYQKEVILPNISRILNFQKGLKLLDVACGQGFFSREFAKLGFEVTGSDISSELIDEAKKLSPKEISYHVVPADKLVFAKDKSFDVATIILAIQNIENMTGVFSESSRVLKGKGRLILVMMHPAFRIPKDSGWGWDEEKRTQFRRIDAYLSQSQTELLVHPGKKDSPKTISYHRSLQDFSKALFRAGFAITRLEEWISHKTSQKGKREEAENKSRKEIPMFLMMEAVVHKPV